MKISYYVIDVKVSYETVTDATVLYGPFDSENAATDALCDHYNKYFKDDEDVECDAESGRIWMDEGDGTRTILISERDDNEP